MKLQSWYQQIQSGEDSNPVLKSMKMPAELGGHVDMILGISYSNVYPEPVYTFPDGLTIYKSKFLPSKPGELACIGGPMGRISSMVQNVGARSTIRYLSNYLSNVSAGYHPRLDFFQSSLPEMERTFDNFGSWQETRQGMPSSEQKCRQARIDDDI